ncbi:MAG: peptidase S9, partial [Bacteroidales bacterium]|nr:peptidase S9 [Bacteroidales bacterium]
MAIAYTALLSSCNGEKQEDSSHLGSIIGKTSPTIENGIMTPEILHSFGRIGNVEVSPNKKELLYHVTFVDIEENKTNTEIFKMNVDGSEKKQLTFTNNHESSAQWIEDGNKIAFLGKHEGSTQLWVMNTDGSGMECISNIDGGIEGFTYSPDGTKVMYIKSIKSGETVADRYTDLPNATGRIVDDLMYKHWDHWVESVPHTFYATIENGKLTNHIDLLEGQP